MNRNPRADGHRDLSYEILAYLAEHPHAQDTLEGIMNWWLLEQEIKHWTAEVQAALADLVDEGLVLEHKGKDARIHYGINRHKAREIRAVLEERNNAGKD